MNTNQAFIRAYRHDAPQPLPAGHAAESLAHIRAGVQVAGAARGERPVRANVFEPTVAYVSPAAADIAGFDSEMFAAQASDVIESEFSPYAPDTLANAAYNAATTAHPAPRQPLHRPSSTKRPLSSFMKQGAGPQRSTLELRPGTTISAFRFPPVCRNLLQLHGAIFESVAETLLAQADLAHTIVGVIGMFRGVGATTITMCLAAELASRGRRVAVVDGHFQSPQLAACLDAEPTAWWQDVLERGAPLGDAMVRAEDDQFDLLPLDPYARSAAPGLQLSASAGALRHAYELCLVDLGTFFDPDSQPSALNLIRHMRIDAALAVASAGGQDARDLESITEHFQACGCELLGTIENRAVR